MAGPAPIPLERKRQRGNPGKRAIPEATATIALAGISDEDVPAGLGEAGTRFWSRSVDIAGGWVSRSDAELLRLTAEALDRRQKILETLDSEGWTITTDKGYPYKHPLAGLLVDLEKQIGQWLAQLGFNPTDRSRLGVAEVKPKGTLELLRERAANTTR
jgi:P27 family predicted phage terminase small subunit